MSLILKMTAGLYIISVLAFSSWSRALDVIPETQFTNSNFSAEALYKQVSSLNTVSEIGYVFEDDGYLFFQSEEDGISFLIHTNSFDLFKSLNLPVRVSLEGQVLVNSSGLYNFNRIVQVTNFTPLEL